MLLKRKPSQNNRSHKPSENPLGKRSAGNLHAAFDEAEAGNVTRREAEFATTEFVVTLGKSIESARQLSTLPKCSASCNKPTLGFMIFS